ncbi:MAG: vitamin K epoxide reductase family protein [Candidatus Paceibacteria bacterium]
MIKTIFLLSLLGLADSIYLTIKHFTHSDINCSIFNGCDLVTTSIYSTILGVPVALLGVIFYGLVLTFAVRRSLALLLIISSIGFLISIWFVYTQGFILNAFCFYCLISAGISTTLFILSLILMVKYKKHETNS